MTARKRSRKMATVSCRRMGGVYNSLRSLRMVNKNVAW
jgi:hypothetical protein